MHGPAFELANINWYLKTRSGLLDFAHVQLFEFRCNASNCFSRMRSS
jgi:hypothetical protein